MDLAFATAGWITFMRPAALVALLAVGVPPLLAWLARRRGRRISPVAVAAQSLALAAAALAAAQPLAAMGGRARLGYLLAVDASGSVRGQAAPVTADDFPAGAQVETYAFANGLRRAGTPADVSATRIGPVLRLIASRGHDQLAGAVIATDGRFSDTDWPGAAQASAGGPELLIVPMDNPPPDARVASLTVRRTTGGTVELAVSVWADRPMRRSLTVTRAGRAEPLRVRPLNLLARGPVAVVVNDALPEDAAAEYTARLDGGDAFPENDSASVLARPLRRTIGIVGATPHLRATLARALPNARWLAQDELPASQAGLSELSGVVVFDATGAALAPPVRLALAEYVRAGGGLVLIGTGPHAKPADDRDELNRVLPLWANPFRRRPLHLSVLLDRSGSMAQPAPAEPGAAAQIKFDLAAEAVAALSEHLTPRDALTVITFADRAAVAYDSGAGPPDFAAMRRALADVRPAGSTRVLPALREALARPAAPGRTPMLLVLSDLRTEAFDPAPWADALRRAGAQLAVVAIGQADDDAPPLEALAQQLAAPYERRDHLAGLAAAFGRLVRRGRGDAIRVGPVRIERVAPIFDAGAALPDADAYILSALRKRSELLARTPEGDPILASRRAGLGRSVCLALPLTEEHNLAWARSPAAAKLISSAARWAAAGDNDPRLDVTATRAPGGLLIEVTARQDDRAVNRLKLTAAVAAGDDVRTAELLQTAPGRYTGETPFPADQAAAIEVRDHTGSSRWHGSVPRLYDREYSSLGADAASLRRLARLTGGRIVTADRLAQTIRRAHRARMTHLWPYLLACALVILLLEWSLTRITRN